ncbi:MAG TPA: ComEC/Rec2 family competence protein [Candidatus Saccharimonadales bacterium]|nr:ComEC/Rec2 family competence protein [Candidatus Saccharimonadales bacterium]
MTKKIHVSWLLAWASIGLMAGAALSLLTDNYFLSFSWLVIGTSLVFASLVNRTTLAIIAIIAGGLLIGLWRGTQNYPSENTYGQFINHQVELSGTVSEDVTLGKDGQQQIRLKDIVLEGRPLAGRVWVSTDAKLDIKRSDQLHIRGQLGEGFGNFSAVVYRTQITEVKRVKYGDPALEARDWFSSSIRQIVNEPQASLGIGFLTGQHSTLPENLTNNLRILGLTHIIVASGYNLTILVRLARRLFEKISKYLATLVSGLLVASFILVTGSSPSMTRAGLITGLSLAAWYYGRKIHPLVLLPFAAGITVLIDPSYLWGDLGWYLSFAAFAGVIILSPLLLDYFWGKNQPDGLLRIVVETFSAQALTAPIIAFSFGQYATLALIANVLILPLIPFAMIFTFIAGVFGAMFGPAAELLGYPAQILLSYMTFVADKLAGLPIAQSNVALSLPYLVAAYILITMFCIWLWRRTKHDFTKDSIVE